jgi:hypothetical protein
MKCPQCANGMRLDDEWTPEAGYDPSMHKWWCPDCSLEVFTVKRNMANPDPLHAKYKAEKPAQDT